jgi:hypothetical protein
MSSGGDATLVGGIIADLSVDSGKMESGLARGRQAMQMVEQELKQLEADLNRGALSHAAYAARVRELTDTQQQLANAMRAAYAAVGMANGGLNIAARNLNMVGGASGHAARALLQLGYMVDDVQYGFAGIVNNIAPFVLALSGGNQSLAAGAQVAAVAAYQLYSHWDELMASFGAGKVLTEAEAMEKLAKATEKTVEQEEKLAKFKRDQGEIKSARLARTDEEKAQKGPVEHALVNGGWEKARQALIDQSGEMELTPAEKKELEELRARQADPFAEPDVIGGRRLDELENKKRRMEFAREHAEGLMHGAQTDPEQLRELIKKLEAAHAANPKSVPPGLLKDLEDALPENRKQQAEFERQGELNNKKAEAQAKHNAEIAQHDEQVTKESADVDNRQSEDIARKLMKGKMRDRLLMNPDADISDEVDSAMKNMGVGRNNRARLGPLVEAALRNQIRDDINAEVGEHGGTPGAAGARLAFREQAERDRHKELETQRLMGKAEDKLPGLHDQIERGRMLERVDEAAGLRKPGDKGGLLDQVKAALKAQGFTEEQQKEMAPNLIREADRSIDKKVRGELENPDGGEGMRPQFRHSQVFNTADLAHKVQSAVGGEDPQRQLVNQNKDIIKLLTRIEAKTQVPFDFGGLRR